MANIYFLQNPSTKEIFYVGCTKKTLHQRLDSHYRHLKECKEGKRKWNNRLEYIEKIYPSLVEIHLIDEVEECDLAKMEIMYIGLFKSWGFNLTNMTTGGDGGNTIISLDKIAKEKYSLKLSKALTGIKKPKGFSENMSTARTGAGNPRAGVSKYPPIVQMDKEGNFINVFTTGYEINEAMKNKYAHGKILKICNIKSNPGRSGYMWRFLPDCTEEIQKEANNFLKK